MSRRWLLAAALWTLYGLLTGLQVWISMITHGHSVPRLVGYYILVCEGWLALSYVIVRLTRRFPVIPFDGRNLLIHSFAAVIVAVIHMTYWMTLTLTMRPYDRMTVTWEELPVSELLLSRLPLELIMYLVVLGVSQATQL